MYGCKKSEALKSHSEVLSTGSSILSDGDGAWDLLAHGYDATGDFSNPNKFSDVPIINIDRFRTDYPQRMVTGAGSDGADSVYLGSTALDYLKQINRRRAFGLEVTYGTKEDTSKVFMTGSVKKNKENHDSSTYYSKYSYGTVQSYRNVKRVRFSGDASVDLLLNYLSPEFINNVATRDANYLVTRYGTHVLLDISLGGYLRYDYSGFNESSSEYSQKIRGTKLALTGVLKKIGLNITSDESTEEINKVLNESRDFDFSATYYGGTNSGLTLTVDKDGNSAQSLNISSWQQSVNDRNCRVIKVDKAVRLSEFITDPVKKAQVNAAIEKHILDSQIKERGEVPVYAYYSRSLNVWRFELNPAQVAYLHDGSWESKGIYFYAFKAQVPGSVPIYEFYAPTTRDCTWSRGNLTSSYWQNGGVKFYAYPSATSGTKPIYSYYHQRSGRSHYLGQDPSRPAPQNEWIVEGVAFYAPE